MAAALLQPTAAAVASGAQSAEARPPEPAAQRRIAHAIAHSALALPPAARCLSPPSCAPSSPE
eukprot:129723-Prymnesium_polylepis.1